MGLFRGVKNTFKKTEAAVVVQNVLDDMVVKIRYEGDAAK